VDISGGNDMEDTVAKLQQMQQQLLALILEHLQRWLQMISPGAFDPDVFLQFVMSLGLDPSQLSHLVGQPDGIDPYLLMGLEKTASDQEIKKRYRQFLMKLHPDTAGMPGTDRLLKMILDAYQQIAKERRWDK
jgi:DnaJ-domain-containing protein 1